MWPALRAVGKEQRDARDIGNPGGTVESPGDVKVIPKGLQESPGAQTKCMALLWLLTLPPSAAAELYPGQRMKKRSSSLAKALDTEGQEM